MPVRFMVYGMKPLFWRIEYAVFQVTVQDGEWLTLDGRFEVHVSEVRPVKAA